MSVRQYLCSRAISNLVRSTSHRIRRGQSPCETVGTRWGRERARQETESLLTDGIATPGHHLLNIVDDGIDAVVGTLWWAHSDRFGRKVAFIFDLTIQAKFRRKGYASSTLKHLESMVRTAGYEALSLHVFAFNTSAQALYEKMGYTPTSMSMTREL